MQKQKPQQTFNSGIVEIYETLNGAPPGDKPVLELKPTPLHSLRFEERTVGFSRFYAGYLAEMAVGRLYRCPRMEDVTTKNVAIHKGIVYLIRQVQYPRDVFPPVMDLSLERK